MSKTYLYKVTTDSGAAPCVHGGLLSLAICKPGIREKVRTGDIIFGIGGKRYKERLIYVAEVTDVIQDGDYYRPENGYTGREDCIYEWRGNKLALRKNAKHHTEPGYNMAHDVGKSGQHRGRANVVISDRFVYYGKNAKDTYKGAYPALAKIVASNMRPYRVNHTDSVIEALHSLRSAVFAKDGRQQVCGTPHESGDACCPTSTTPPKKPDCGGC